MTTFQINLQKAKRLGTNLTILATSISLAACGGGGSEGYFNNNNGSGAGGNTDTGNNTDTQTKEVAAIEFDQPSKTQLSVDGDEVTITARAVDANGGGVSGKNITLAINDFQNVGAISDTSVKTTDDTGTVTFTVKLSGQNKDVNKLIFTATLQGTTIQNVQQVSVVSGPTQATSVSYLTAQAAGTIDSKGGTTIVRVKALDANGGALADQSITLNIQNSQANHLIIQGASQIITDANGEANFTVVYDGKITDINQLQQLVNDGILITATSGNISQVTRVHYQIANQAKDISNLNLSLTKGVVVAEDDTVDLTVTAVDSTGMALVGKSISLALNDEAKNNGVQFTSGSTLQTNSMGQATFSFKVASINANAVNVLTTSGITFSVSAVLSNGETLKQQIQAMAVPTASALLSVSYLTINSSSAIETSGGQATVTVQALNSQQVGVANKDITLSLANSQAGLNIQGSNTLTTNAQGQVNFTVALPAGASANEVQQLLKGVIATASYSANNVKKTQVTTIQFSNSVAAAAEDIELLQVVPSKNIVKADNDTFTFTVQAYDKSDKPANGKSISIGLDQSSLNNGVTYDSRTKTTDAQGQAAFTIKVNAANAQAITNLVANSITISAATILSTGERKTQQTQVSALAPETVAPTVTALQVNPSAASISGVGGSSVIAVRAVDANNNPVANQMVSFALAGTNTRVAVDKLSDETNSQGYAYFTVSVSNGDLDNELIKNGITYAVNTINQQTGNVVSGTYPGPVSQIGKINVSVPAGTYNLLPLTPSKSSLLISGDTVTVTSKLVDNKGAPLKSQPVTLVVNNVANNGGINVEGGMTAVTDTNGNVSFKLTLPAKTNQAQINELLNNGLTIKTSVTLPNGYKRYSPDLKLNIEAAVNPNHLEIISSNENLSVNGDKAIVTVRLLTNAANQPVADQQVTLKVKKTNSTTGTNIGIVNEAEGNGGITDTYTVTTDQNGNGFFTLLIPESGLDKDALLASGIELEASQTDANGIIVKQVSRLGLDRPGSTAARYNLRIASNKPTLNVRNDSAEVTVTLLDQNGGRIADRYVTLNVADFVRNGASIVGASGRNTDANGEAIFTVKIDETVRNQNYTAAQFDTDNLVLRATSYMASTQEPNTLQDFMIDVVQANVPNPIGNLTFGKSALLEKSNDGNYYIEAVSAQLVDRDGKPIANQPVTMSIDLLGIGKGEFNIVEINNEKTRVRTTTALCFGAMVPPNTQIATGFVSSQGSTNNIVTYTTDSTGKFDFRIRYLRQYASWQTVNLTARVTINGQPVQNLESSLNYPLTMLKDDFDSEAGQPFDRSPYGTGSTCQ